MTPALLASLRAGLLPGDALPGLPAVGLPVTMDWNIDGEASFVATGTIVEMLPDDRALWYAPNERIGLDNRSLAFLRFPLSECAVRQRVAVVMGAGQRCPAWSLAPDPEHLPGYAGPPCPSCRGTGYLRPPAPARHLLPVSELGDLPDALAVESAGLLACHVARVLAGLGGVQGVFEDWKNPGRAIVNAVQRWPSGEYASRWCLSSDLRLEVGSLILGRHDYRPGWWLVENDLGRRQGPRASGPETGPAGMAAADRAALLAGFALHNADGMVLPWPEVTP